MYFVHVKLVVRINPFGSAVDQDVGISVDHDVANKPCLIDMYM
jgi:hypothetical protein